MTDDEREEDAIGSSNLDHPSDSCGSPGRFLKGAAMLPGLRAAAYRPDACPGKTGSRSSTAGPPVFDSILIP
jgi:hypothetical protein